MRLHPPVLLFLIFLTGLFVQCHKTGSDRENVHNHDLMNKTLPQIQAEIAGRWQIKRSQSIYCPVIGCDTVDTAYYNNEGDLISFLTNDTVKRAGYTGLPVKIYEKAYVLKFQHSNPAGYTYAYSMDNGHLQYTMQEIKNDSLVMVSGRSTYYLTRKP